MAGENRSCRHPKSAKVHSEYEGILHVALQSWRRGALSDRDFAEGAEKVFSMLGSDRCNRTTEDWVVDLKPETKRKIGWQATPYAGYMEDVRAEGFYDGLAQAYYMTAGSMRQLNDSYILLRQFTSPGAHHTERIRFGQMSTFNLLDTRSARSLKIRKDGEEVRVEVECVTPACPRHMPCLGLVEITDVYFQEKSWHKAAGYAIERVEHRGRNLPWRVYARLGMAPYGCGGIEGCDLDKATLAFLLRAESPEEKEQVRIVFRKTGQSSTPQKYGMKQHKEEK